VFSLVGIAGSTHAVAGVKSPSHAQARAAC